MYININIYIYIYILYTYTWTRIDTYIYTYTYKFWIETVWSQAGAGLQSLPQSLRLPRLDNFFLHLPVARVLEAELVKCEPIEPFHVQVETIVTAVSQVDCHAVSITFFLCWLVAPFQRLARTTAKTTNPSNIGQLAGLSNLGCLGNHASLGTALMTAPS